MPVIPRLAGRRRHDGLDPGVLVDGATGRSAQPVSRSRTSASGGHAVRPRRVRAPAAVVGIVLVVVAGAGAERTGARVDAGPQEDAPRSAAGDGDPAALDR